MTAQFIADFNQLNRDLQELENRFKEFEKPFKATLLRIHESMAARCDHRIPDGEDAGNNGFAYSFGTICGAEL